MYKSFHKCSTNNSTKQSSGCINPGREATNDSSPSIKKDSFSVNDVIQGFMSIGG